jgi:glycosyltransferase involved in cell wall biosynthesis
VYSSLKNQTLKHWEWIIIDDSVGDDNFEFLKKKFSDDSRIRIFKRFKNNGSIGSIKNETIGLCRGKYLLEMDHDDELLPWVLEDSAKLFESDNEIGFIYTDCSFANEDGSTHFYGDFLCKGYGSYYSQKHNNKWVLVYNTPNINNITLSHLVCCPNHPRIWRRDVLLRLGSYCEYLPVCDDYEILLRTCIETKMAKIHKLGYIQYMNNNNNNFSLIRNSEINRIGPHYISPFYYEKFDIHQKMKDIDAYEDEKYIENCSKIYERDINNYEHKYCNKVINFDYDNQYCIIGIDSLVRHMETIKELYKNVRNDFLVLESKSSLGYLQQKLDHYGFERMKCYSLIGSSKQSLINYFMLMYKSVQNYEIIDVDIYFTDFNSKYDNRFEIINSLTNKNSSYLEIGVENGFTFNNVHFENKLGVDPDPKMNFNLDKIIKSTSDEYFKNNNKIFDVIFIDGMHQVEYILNDVNNSIKYLHDNGLLFIDDILPFNYNEQLKIPIKHYYENGILKYGEAWTGDVWKIIYFILQNLSEKVSFSYYSNINYRGVAVFEIKEKFEIDKNNIEIINNYDYFKEFKHYIHLIDSFNTLSTQRIMQK